MDFKTIKIGNQEWMLENLNITDEYLGKDHWKNSKTGEVYYSWDAAVRMSKKVKGFHLPSAEDLNKLAEKYNCICENPKSKQGWRDYSNTQELKNELNIKCYGYYCGNFLTLSLFACFWSSSKRGYSCYITRFNNDDNKIESFDGCKEYACSVRLVKD